jgi:murein peptide amidase A
VIHGNETAGLAITSALRRIRPPRGVQLWLVPELNPDGVAAGTRQNADGVDLNRNFPYLWKFTSEPVYYCCPPDRSRRRPWRATCGPCGRWS